MFKIDHCHASVKQVSKKIIIFILDVFTPIPSHRGDRNDMSGFRYPTCKCDSFCKMDKSDSYFCFYADYTSWRDTNKGSIYISTLCEVFAKYGKTKCFVKLLGEVSTGHCATFKLSRKKQCSSSVAAP